MPSWQRAAPGEGTGHGSHLPSESARALEALNNANFDTNELGIFRHREGAEQGKRVQPGGQEASSPIRSIQSSGRHLLFSQRDQTMGGVGRGTDISRAPVLCSLIDLCLRPSVQPTWERPPRVWGYVSQTAHVQGLLPPFPTCVTPGKLFHLCALPSLHLHNGQINGIYILSVITQVRKKRQLMLLCYSSRHLYKIL